MLAVTNHSTFIVLQLYFNSTVYITVHFTKLQSSSHRFMVYVLGANVSRDARVDQWLGMYVVSAMGYLVSRLALPLGKEARSILAGIAVSVSGQ